MSKQQSNLKVEHLKKLLSIARSTEGSEHYTDVVNFKANGKGAIYTGKFYFEKEGSSSKVALSGNIDTIESQLTDGDKEYLWCYSKSNPGTEECIIGATFEVTPPILCIGDIHSVDVA